MLYIKSIIIIIGFSRYKFTKYFDLFICNIKRYIIK